MIAFTGYMVAGCLSGACGWLCATWLGWPGVVIGIACAWLIGHITADITIKLEERRAP